GSAADHHASKLADLLVEASNGEMTRAEILRWLLHHRDGRSLARAFKRQQIEHPATSTEKGNPVNRTEELADIAKRHGCHAVAEHIVAKGGFCTEAEFVDMIKRDIQCGRATNESREKCFVKFFCADDERGQLLRRAVKVC